MNIDDFTGQFSLSKTLRFELKPVSQTQYWIEKDDVIRVDEEQLLKGKEAERALNYKWIKKLLDVMHRLFISEVLSLDTPEWRNALGQLVKQVADDGLDNKTRRSVTELFSRRFNAIIQTWDEAYRKEMPVYWRQDIVSLTHQMDEAEEKKRKDYFKKIIQKLENKIKKTGKEQTTSPKLKLNHLLKEEVTVSLLEWQTRKGQIVVSGKDIGLNDSDELLSEEQLLLIIRSFDGFSTMLSGFNENRQNIYDLNKKSFITTSIAHRIFEENLPCFIANSQRLNTVMQYMQQIEEQEKCPAWKADLAECEQALDFNLKEILEVEGFIHFLSQTGITRYNSILGGFFQGAKKIKGLNELINLARQQHKAKRTELPTLRPLYKQILSQGDGIQFDTIQNDDELLNELMIFVSNYLSDTHCIKRFMQQLLDIIRESSNELELIYIKKTSLNSLSHLLVKQWHGLSDCMSAQMSDKEQIAYEKKEFISIKTIEHYLSTAIDGQTFYEKFNIAHDASTVLNSIYQQFSVLLLDIEQTKTRLFNTGMLEFDKGSTPKHGGICQSKEKIAIIKAFLDACNDLARFMKLWLPDKKMPLTRNMEWYSCFENALDEFPVSPLYNKVRNYVTRKPYSNEKLAIKFEQSTLLSGWDRDKEVDNLGLLFRKKGRYYLGILNNRQHQGANKLFDYTVLPDDSKAMASRKQALRDVVLSADGKSSLEKMVYKQLGGADKMFPKVFFGKKGAAYFSPSNELIHIKTKKLYTKENIAQHGIENLHKYIAFCIECACKHKVWSKAFDLHPERFRRPEEYRSIDEFYSEVDNLCYRIQFVAINESYVVDKVESGELYFFEVYNKDFSINKKNKGRDNLHTSYWKQLFSSENLRNVVLKLNGEAEIFFRPASIHLSDDKKNKGYHVDELSKKFDYPIVKDRRYTEDKFLFHCPITLNFKQKSQVNMNARVQDSIVHSDNMHIIGIDRGEKHLLYYCVVDGSGNIVEQDTLNRIETGEKTVDYLEKLSKKERSRDNARKSWSQIENIKDLKSGYLSHIVYKIAQLIVRYNAIVVLEDLNTGFKRGRFKIERQVYQNFEKALINKLNYLTFKDRVSPMEAGHYLNAYQLTAPFESFQKLGRQSGILFYVDASYTSVTDPVSGFAKNIYKKYTNVDDMVTFWSLFDAIEYDPEHDRFGFSYDIRQFSKPGSLPEKHYWTVWSCVCRTRYKNRVTEIFDVNAELKMLLKENGLDYQKSADLKLSIMSKNSRNDSGFHRTLLYLFNAILNLRVTDPDAQQNGKDFILSPVAPFYDSRTVDASLPENSDANGAYNIARKGIVLVNKIKSSGKAGLRLSVTKKDWLDFCQEERLVELQKKKLS